MRARTRTLAAIAAIGLVAAACSADRPGRCADPKAGDPTPASIRVGADLEVEPFTFTDDDGTATGFDLAVLREVGTRLGAEVKVAQRTVSTLIPDLLARRFEIAASGLVRTEDLAGQVCTTAPYLDADLAVAVNPERSPEATGTGDLAGQPVAVVERTPGAAWARRTLRDTAGRIDVVPTDTDAFNSLRDGAAFAVVFDAASTRHRALSDPSVRIVEVIDTGSDRVFAVHPDSGRLLAAIDLALETMRDDGTYAELSREWFGPDASP